MSLYNTNGVIIKALDFKENDKLVWVFTENLGKITAIAKGAKKNKNKLFSITLPLCYGSYTVFKGKNMYNLQEGSIQNSFQGLMSNLDKLTYSSYLCELIDISLGDDDRNPRLFKDFITTLYLLDTDAIDYEMLVRSFELKLLKDTGYGLTLDSCCNCKNKISVSDYISLSGYGGVCQDCERTYGVRISRGAYNALKFLQTVNLDKVYRLNLTQDIKDEVRKVTTYLISNSYSKKPKSLEMLNYIKE